jgi:hypothetical protein
MATPFKIYIRPAPELPPLPPGTSKQVVDALENLRRWCRDAERAFRSVESVINTLQAEVIPAGGVTGQALKKNSGKDYDASWA